ncbi:acyl-CoA dehydrogenase [Leptospira brenneri]|uniref:Acyl-CoA dehydrogenase n=1 Tax=Leptospira brenneri TaxID=2023182 RepID=A0A2M9Y199_9LEPT|nr:acyl-CoA dehydrogenase [Leptospira brenneri]PJZ45332.1 acyl-CoA dehydrogenase [Leptospira brenneri]TGK91822.1 acyl-CoA dehydrogenase [Leptospira brenneri]
MSRDPENLILKYGILGSSYPQGVKGEEIGFYRSWKPYLIQAGFYHFLLGLESYLEFQKKLSLLSEEKVGVSLALACMVEVNVAGGILAQAKEGNTSHTKKSEESSDSLWDAFREENPVQIFAVGVSEPGWETKLRKLSSKVQDGKLSGTKSFITNGGEADTIFWVTKADEGNPVYLVRRKVQEPTDLKLNSNEADPRTQIQEEFFHTDFTPQVSHLKLSLCEYPISSQDLVLRNYGNLGLTLRLKELLSLVSLLIGKTKKISLEVESVAKEREKLIAWREVFLSNLKGNPSGDFLLSGFPYPIEGLLATLTEYWNLSSPKELKTIDPDFQLFVWEDQFTQYLIQKKKRKL